MTTDNINDKSPFHAILGRNGHDIITSGFSPVAERKYFWMYVMEDTTVTYNDAAGTEHASVALKAGTSVDVSGSAPTVASGSIVAWID